MDGNHEWQRQRTRQQINNRRRTAEAERQVRAAAGVQDRPAGWTRLMAFLRSRTAAPGGAGDAAFHKRGVKPT